MFELIDRDTLWWNKGLLDELFISDEVKAILFIPLSCTSQNDRLIWRGTMKCIFSARSAYHLAKEGEAMLQAECSEKGELSDLWRSLWKLRVPNVEIFFLWRACNDILPTKANMCKRKVINDPLCPICGLAAETGLHILWDCPSAKDVWGSSGRKLQKSSLGGPTFCHVVKEVFNSCGEDEIKLFVCIARKIWSRRNEVTHGGPFCPSKHVGPTSFDFSGGFFLSSEG